MRVLWRIIALSLFLSTAASFAMPAFGLAAGAGKSGPEFSAVLTLESGQASTRMKVNFTRNMQRVEYLPPDKGTAILREDMGVVWNLMPSKKLFLEKKLEPENKNPLVYEPEQVTDRVQLGKEKLAGRPVIKERLKFKNEGGAWVEIFYWTSPGLGWPVRAEAVDGSWKLYYSDIKPGRQDRALFEAPAGFGKIIQPKKMR